MPTVHVEITVPGSVHEVERLWYDTSRWPTWVHGLAHVERVQGDWPAAGGKVVWDSTPAGRGRVVERVTEHEPLRGQTVEVEDDSVRGSQRVAFTPSGEQDVRIDLSLAYAIKRRTIITPLLDLLFVRRAMTASLQATVRRFAIELTADDREPGARRPPASAPDP
jgi:hypothetical protein